jgi:hypothetical protein
MFIVLVTINYVEVSINDAHLWSLKIAFQLTMLTSGNW